MPRTECWLRAFELEGDKLLGKWRLESVAVEELCEMFGSPDDDLYGEYEVLAHHVSRLVSATGTKIELDRYAYFVGATAAD